MLQFDAIVAFLQGGELFDVDPLAASSFTFFRVSGTRVLSGCTSIACTWSSVSGWC